jgi:uncharacterized protein YbcI
VRSEAPNEPARRRPVRTCTLCGIHHTVRRKGSISASDPPNGGEPDSRPGAGDARPGQLTQITRAMVAIYKDQFGRGPTHARSHYAGPDMIVCALEDTLTPIERTLVSIGEHQRLRDIRALFQHTAEDAFRSAVEDITGRTVVAFSSGFDTNADVATEVFLLERPNGERSAPA